MNLQESQVRELIKKPRNSFSIQKGLEHEQRLKFHGKNALSSRDLSRYNNDFMSWVNSILPQDKYDRFSQLVTYPLTTVEFTEGIFSEFTKVFHANDSFKKDLFTRPELEADYSSWYRENYEKYFENTGINVMRNEINNVLVIHLPKEQNGDRPEPYCHVINIDDFIDIDVDNENNCQYFIYRIGAITITDELGNPTNIKEAAVVLDDGFYRLYNITNNEPKLLVETPHDLGYCPARSYWTDNLTHENNILKKSPVSGSLGVLDMLLFKEVSKEYAAMYSEYPILATIEQKCDYSDDFGNNCENGYTESFTNGESVKNPCPTCKGKTPYIGAGTNLITPVPDADQPEMSTPAQFITVDTKSLEYTREDITKRKDQIWLNVVGKSSDLLGKEALNQDQVNASFESKRIILNNIKRNFELIEAWKRGTLAKLRYGSDRHIKSVVDYGTEFFLKTVEDLQNEKRTAKENGASQAELKIIQEQIIQTKFRNNPLMLNRMMLLFNLEPLPLMSGEKIVELREKGLISQEDYIKKLYFDDFIQRFERDNISLDKFGELLEFKARVNKINNKLDEYVTEKVNKSKQEPGLPDSGGREGILPHENNI